MSREKKLFHPNRILYVILTTNINKSTTRSLEIACRHEMSHAFYMCAQQNSFLLVAVRAVCASASVFSIISFNWNMNWKYKSLGIEIITYTQSNYGMLLLSRSILCCRVKSIAIGWKNEPNNRRFLFWFFCQFVRYRHSVRSRKSVLFSSWSVFVVTFKSIEPTHSGRIFFSHSSVFMNTFYTNMRSNTTTIMHGNTQSNI